MSPIPQANGHDAPRLVCEPVPSFTAVIEDVAVGGEDPVGEPVLAHELPDVLDRVQLRGVGADSILYHLPVTDQSPRALSRAAPISGKLRHRQWFFISALSARGCRTGLRLLRPRGTKLDRPSDTCKEARPISLAGLP